MSLFDTDKVNEKRNAWLNERKKGVGGSEIACILGISRFRTAYNLWLEKTGQVQPEDISGLPHVQRGVQGEVVCRAILEQRDNVTYKPKTWNIPDTIFRGSDDGYCLDTETLLEIKCMGRADHDKARNEGAIPEYYRVQCQWNLMVSGAKRCVFVSFRPEDCDYVEIVVMPDPSKWDEMKEAALRFWKCVETMTPPALTPKDYKQIDDQAFDTITRAYVELKDKRDKLNEQLTELEQQIKTYTSSHTAIMNSYVRVLKTTRKGTVDYGKMAAENSIDQEKYRKPPTTVCTISVL